MIVGSVDEMEWVSVVRQLEYLGSLEILDEVNDTVAQGNLTSGPYRFCIIGCIFGALLQVMPDENGEYHLSLWQNISGVFFLEVMNQEEEFLGYFLIAKNWKLTIELKRCRL